MSNHNYSKYSNNKKNKNPDTQKNGLIVDDLVPETPVEVKMEVDAVEVVETVCLPEAVTGTVTNCAKLNVRAAANRDAKVLTVVDANTVLKIDTSKSDNNWLCVETNDGVIGYCMRQYVDAKL